MALPKLIVVLGTTACGKSGLGVELAKRFGGEIVSADSRQVYRGLDLGTGKVTEEEMEGVPHHMLDVVEPNQPYSVAEFQAGAYAAIDGILSRGNTPFLVGGTGLYVRAVTEGFTFTDARPDPALRAKLEGKTTAELYALLRWLDGYTVGARNAPLAVETSVTEFRKLNDAARRYAERAESSFERQKQFIGNASHEMQTPLAVCRNRLEMLVDDAHALTGEQLGEIAKVQRTLDYLVRLNRSLLLLSKIDNGQFPEAEEVDVNALVRRTAEDMEEIYAYRSMRFALVDEGPLTARMNPSLAGSVVANLLKNAFVHGDEGGEVTVRVAPRRFTVCNSGAGGPLDAGRIFDRFYQGTKKEGSTGLGLAVVDAVCRLYGLKVSYSYKEGRHCFAVDFPA